MLPSLLTWSFFLFMNHVKTVSIYVTNAGFESTTGFTKIPIPQNTYYWEKNVIIDQWTLYDEGAIAKNYALGVHNPVGGDLFYDSILGDTTPEGLICGYIEQEDASKQGKGALGIEQTLSETVSAHTVYTLSVWIGNSANNCFSKDSTGNEPCYNDRTGFPGYRVQLLAGDNILSEDDDTLSIDEGQWAQSTVSYTTSDTDIYIGDILGIRLLNKNNANGVEVSFDDVQLDAITTTTTTTSAVITTMIESSTAEADTTSSLVSTTATLDITTAAIESTTALLTSSTAVEITDVSRITTDKITTDRITTDRITTDRITTDRKTTDVKTSESMAKSTVFVEQSNEDENKKNTDSYMSQINFNTWITIVCVAVVLCVLCSVIVCLLKNLLLKSDKIKEDEKQMTDVMCETDKNIEIETNDPRYIEMHEWFESIGLSQYASLFVENGYDSMLALMSIHNRSDIKDIGVKMVGHQSLILCEIEQLKKDTNGDGFETTAYVNHVQQIKEVAAPLPASDSFYVNQQHVMMQMQQQMTQIQNNVKNSIAEDGEMDDIDTDTTDSDSLFGVMSNNEPDTRQ